VTDGPRVALTLEQCWHRVPGGTAVAAIGMARGLARRADVDVVGVAALHRGPPRAPGGAEAWAPPVPVRSLPLPRRALYEAWHRLRRPHVELATGAVDVVHATTLAIPPRSAPLVVTLHDLAWRHDPGHFTAHGVRFFERGLALALADANLVLCASAATLRDCETAGFARDRLRHVPLGVEMARASPADVERVRARHDLHRPYVLWTGTVEPRKNLRRLVEAFGRLEAGADLVLVGPRGWSEDLDELTGSARRVRALGFVPSADLPGLYAGARAFCFPSLLEGFGFPVLEAMTQGTPVVTARGTSTEEIAGDAALLVDPRDADSIAGGLAQVLDDTRLASELSERGLARAACFTWDRCAERVRDAYREVAA
jgi:glycosyltransferase involved in cell wall biosynthesis